MNVLIYLGAVACVFGTAMGQVLFKAGANALNESDGTVTFRPLALLLIAFSTYFITSLGWVLLLKRASLGQLYPLLALSFVLVPIASVVFFGEQLSSKYFLGVFLTVAGVMLCLRS